MYSYGRGRATPRVVSGTDKRYQTHRWRRLALAVRQRDGLCRIVAGCPRKAQVADHVNPVYPGMSDAEFFDIRYIRGGCQYHNKMRGIAEKAHAEGIEVGGRSFSSTPSRLGPLAKLPPLVAQSTIFVDYTRRARIDGEPS